MNSRAITFLAAGLAFSLLYPRQSFAQTKEACAAYSAAVTASSPGAVPVIPDNLLTTNWRVAVDCLVPILGGMKSSVRAASNNASTRAKFLSAAGGLRAIATRIGAGEEVNNALPADKRNPNIDTIALFAKEFQKVETIEAVAVLTTGARSDNYDMRLTGILVLGNVMDERYACVPLVQILDPDLMTADYGINARANLLGMLSRVAPYVYKEDFANVRNVRTLIGQTVSKDDPNLAQTNLILQNIDQRLDAQTDSSNRGVSLERDFKERCAKYLSDYPATDQMKTAITY